MATILVVDDEDNIRFLFRFSLSNQHTVLEASNGADALILYDHFSPDLIISDLTMPFMSGYEMVRNIRSSDSKVKIIATSALFHCSEERNLLLMAGADLCLPKPVDITTMHKSISDLLSFNQDCKIT